MCRANDKKNKIKTEYFSKHKWQADAKSVTSYVGRSLNFIATLTLCKLIRKV